MFMMATIYTMLGYIFSIWIVCSTYYLYLLDIEWKNSRFFYQ